MLTKFRSAAVGTLSAAAVVLGLSVAPASAAPAFTQTIHQNTQVGFNSPLGTATNNGCPSWLENDNVYMNLTGNGVTHFTVNAADDFWFTSTFTGNGSISFWPGQAHYDGDGNIISVDGSPEKSVTGHMVEWFGFEGNRQNSVQHGTGSFRGTIDGSGTPITLHFNIMAKWAVGSDPNGPPTTSMSVASCS